jgi:hypothetical protein
MTEKVSSHVDLQTGSEHSQEFLKIYHFSPDGEGLNRNRGCGRNCEASYGATLGAR